ncbi:antitoxin [Caenispirillum bisanense]|uniref:Antitoxin component of toxin-antitoxin stability system, DNA-binding transcriptional repressor n=1 Tax=Caenispirillum bisanense TaxID=414052 RepID=A0A286GIU8_9PROT|nr:antitoxin [Caenispirillum bisanense]SOD95146.1 hypothetical protein SAMN05421508_104241 [Caenispirillum bisanense]
MGKITVQMKDPKLAEVLASTRAGDEVELKDGDAVVGSFVRREGEPRPRGVRRFGALKGKIHLDESFFDPLPEEELRAWEGRDD